jgi:hypothetical protein
MIGTAQRFHVVRIVLGSEYRGETMRSNQDTRRRLQVRRETFRRLSALSDRQLARVAGGSEGWYDPDPDPTSHWTDDPQSMSTGSRFC